MEKINYDFDQLTGLQTVSYVDEDGALHVDYKQDIEPAMALVRNAREEGEGWRVGIKKSMVHALHIPDGVIHELIKHGINVYTHPFKDVVVALKRIGKYEACDMTGKRLV